MFGVNIYLYEIDLMSVRNAAGTVINIFPTYTSQDQTSEASTSTIWQTVANYLGQELDAITLVEIAGTGRLEH